MLSRVRDEVKHEMALMIKSLIERSARKSGKLSPGDPKFAADHVSKTVSVVSLPNDEMKGRIIGREPYTGS